MNKVRAEQSRYKIGESQKDLNKRAFVCLCMYVCVLTCVPAVNSLLGAAYLHSRQEKVCPLVLDVCECDDG